MRLRVLKSGIRLDSAIIKFKRLATQNSGNYVTFSPEFSDKTIWKKGNPINQIVYNGKEFPCCDFHGNCTNTAYAEVFPIMMKNSKKKV